MYKHNGVLSSIGHGVDRYLEHAMTKHPSTHPSLEHSLCVLEEEVSELRTEIRRQYDERDYYAIAREAYQVAAMAIRLIHDAAIRKADGDYDYA